MQISSDVIAATMDYNAMVSISHYENILRVNTPVDSELSESLRVGLMFSDDTADLTTELVAEYEVIDYRNNSVDDQNVGHLNSILLWKISPEYFEWYVSDIFTQTSIDSTLSDTPSNRQDANAFSTGPNYSIRFNQRYMMDLQLRYNNIYFEQSDYDNNRVTANVSMMYDVNSLIDVSLSLNSQAVDYDNNTINDNYNRYDLFARLEYIRGLNTVDIELGNTSIDLDNDSRINETRYRLSVDNRRSSNSGIQLQAIRQVDDTSSSLLEVESSGADQYAINTSGSDVYTTTENRLIYTKAFHIGEFILSLYRTKVDYRELNTQDQDVKGVTVMNTIDTSRSSRVALGVSRLDIVYDYSVPDRVDSYSSYSIRYTYTARRNIDLDLGFESISNNSNSDVYSYDDNIIMLSLIYSTR